MFDKILIANRGEIACRITETARRMGIATVAVHSDADADARHVRMADEAVHIGPALARDSYLRIDRIIEAAQRSGARAIHPGYGFLSENAAFAQACEQAGIAFIGPPVAAIDAMGSKSAAKALMAEAGVPLTPGYHGDNNDTAFLAAEADRIGYPVLIKASAGGGGKGMRRVDHAGEFAAALASCQREAASAFGNDHVLIERYVLKPRHVEIQVFGDRYGNVVYLFDRDCSVQRRHQKVIEEAPAPGLTEACRAAMGRAAVDAAKAVGYVGAGTVEFILDPDGAFYFMEMNTRLQVEHPVTEMVTGLDLVEWQIRVASGEALPLRQDELALDGHAIEARIYAEDPDKGFLPSTGRLAHLATPAPSRHVRIDTGVGPGDSITPFYDPMIAKLIVWDRDREAALARMRHALAAVEVVGVGNNVDFLSRLVASSAFDAADLDTGLIERVEDELAAPRDLPPAVWQLAALAELGADHRTDPSPWAAADGWRLNGSSWRPLRFVRDGEEIAVDARALDRGWKLRRGAETIEARFRAAAGPDLHVCIGGRSLRATVVPHGAERHVFLDGRSWRLELRESVGADDAAEEADGGLRAPMPSRIIALAVAPGATVAKGAALLVMEAMKMEYTLTAPRAGKVEAFNCAIGDQVAEGAQLVRFEAES